jgi:hypothetical protein
MDEAIDPLQPGRETMSQEQIREFVLSELADLRMVDRDTLEREIATQGGDLTMDSQEGLSITGGLEGKLGRGLAGPETLDPKVLISVNRLTSLLHESMQKPPKSNR